MSVTICRREHGRKLHAGQVRVPEVETVLDDNNEVEFKPCTEYLMYKVNPRMESLKSALLLPNVG